ncbi:dephospho-CoA kinase [Sansalvadorimonas verongulae]|uniref:dephospho-CoA kinase n=1 Tax=Sansalvadorimonas verongulae TaxID=2172824 RepID=UPI002E37C329|nr:dephospho-CoA kinase [Sansalvadorimonas verongulae]MTI15456.1 dephospho-CoA kinase [Sansalvadorimonas verongulae]
MFVVGITGGIGCGKTVVTDYLAQKGIVVADADKASRVVVESGKPALQKIEEHFGSNMIFEDGSLNRRALRDIIFQNANEKKWLEKLLHPLINQQLRLELSLAQSPYVILVSPLLFETRQHDMVDRILVIDVTEEVQIERAIARDNISQEQAESIVRSQSSREERRSRADDIVNNSGSLEQLYQQLETLHRSYLEQAREAQSDHP